MILKLIEILHNIPAGENRVFHLDYLLGALILTYIIYKLDKKYLSIEEVKNNAKRRSNRKEKR